MTAAYLDHVWAASLRGGLALLLAWAFSLLPRVPATLRCWAWRAAYTVLIISFIWTTPVDIAVRLAASAPASVVSLTDHSFQAEAVRPRTLRAPTALATPQPPASRPRLQQLRVAAGSLWLAFLAVYVGHLARGWFLSRRLRDGQPIDVPELADLCRRFAVRPPAVRVHRSIRSPLLVGVWRPTIVLPDPPPADLSLILAHELAHLKRHDLLWNWLPTVAFALLPWHPLVWLAHRRWRLATEAAADADALAATSATVADYGRLLVTVATSRPAGVLAVAAAAGSRWILKQRLSAMTNITRWKRSRLVTAGTVVGVIGMATAVPWRVVAAGKPSTVPTTNTIPTVAFPVVASHLSVLGEVSADVFPMRAAISGTIAKVAIEAGQSVHKGDLLVQLDANNLDMDVDAAQAELEYHRLNVAQGAVQLERARKVGDADEVANAELSLKLKQAQMAVAEARLDRARLLARSARIVAPFDGVVVESNARVRESAATGQTLGLLVRPGPPWVDFDLPQSFAGELRPGASVEVRHERGPGLAAVVEAVSPSIDTKAHTQRVTARLTTDQPTLHAGMFVRVDTSLETPPPATLPAASSDPFPFAVPIELGASKFLPGDSITITSVQGTSADMGKGIYRVSGTYTLASHDSATLAGSVTARDPADGRGWWNPAQQTTVRRGTGTFTLIFPVSIAGWPHVSFYDGSSFGGVYVGTGDAVLRKWWDHDPTDKATGTDGR